MKLLTGPVSLFAKKVEIAAYEKGIPLEFESVPFSLKDRYKPKHPEVLRINPKQQVPVLIDGALELFDSTLIFEYFEDIHPNPPLWPQDPRLRAEARLLELTSDEIIVGGLLKLVNSDKELSREQREQIIAETQEHFSRLDRLVHNREFFFDYFTYADIAVYCGLTLAHLLNVKVPEYCTNLTDWRQRVGARESVQQAMQPLFDYVLEQRQAS